MSTYEHDDAIRSMIRRGRVLKVDDSQSQQFVDLALLGYDKPKKIFRPQDFGFTSNPPADSEGFVVALGGRSDRLLYHDGGHKDYRPTETPAGQAILYDDKGNIIFVKGQNGIEVHAKQGKITIKPADDQLVFLGGDGTETGVTYDFVMTVSGPSANVKARL